MGTREEISMWTNIAEPRVRVSQKRTEERNGLHQLGQQPSFLFPVFNPPYPQGTAFKIDAVVSGITKISNLWVSFSDFV